MVMPLIDIILLSFGVGYVVGLITAAIIFSLVDKGSDNEKPEGGYY